MPMQFSPSRAGVQICMCTFAIQEDCIMKFTTMQVIHVVIPGISHNPDIKKKAAKDPSS